MFDLKNKEYEKVMAYIPRQSVVFKMKNGLAYLVNLRTKKIYIDAVWWNFFKMSPYHKSGDKIPAEELAKAEELLKTAEIPKLNNNEEERFKNILKMIKK